jgi:hypothetical protein
MDVISVVSPDKLSISMFTDFLMKFLGGGYRAGYLHYLMAPEAIDDYLKAFTAENPKAIMRFFANKKISDLSIACPQRLLEASSSVVWFPLYSTEPQLLKDSGVVGALLDRWKANINRMGGAGA